VLTDKDTKIYTNNNKKEFFKIIVNKDSFCIDIIYNLKEKIELENLFLILKSYITSKENLIRGLYVIGSNDDFYKNNIKPNFFRNISLNKIEKINYFDFFLFYEEMLEND
jgi:hypothetical protein